MRADERLTCVDGSIIDSKLRPYLRVQSWLEPDEARVLANRGVPWFVQECGSNDVQPSARYLLEEVLAEMLPLRRTQRMLRAGKTKTVAVAELWLSPGNDVILLFAFGAPGPR